MTLVVLSTVKTTHQVCFVRDAFDEPRDRMWGDVDAVLELSLRVDRVGQVCLLMQSTPGFGNGHGLVMQGWRVAEWTEKELGQVLYIGKSWVDAVTARLPDFCWSVWWERRWWR